MRLSIFSLLLFVPCLALAAQPEERAQAVRFESRDGVNLRGNFYPAKKRNAPVVLCLHELGNDSRDAVWSKLAEALQDKGYAVLTFDFRGHGESTSIESDFWNPNYTSRQLVRPTASGEILFKNFDQRYYPALVNDIAAAKAYLDRRNDAGECNSSNLIVLGAGTGATLGAIWVNAEFSRYQMIPSQLGMPAQLDNKSEGESILCALWLSVAPRLGQRAIDILSVLDLPARTGKMPMVFLSADEDLAGKRLASNCERLWKKSQPLTTAVTVRDAGQRRGTELLHPEFGAATPIAEYLDQVVSTRGQEWTEQDFRNMVYFWRLPSQWHRPFQANQLGDRNLYFQSYEAFIR